MNERNGLVNLFGEAASHFTLNIKITKIKYGDCLYLVRSGFSMLRKKIFMCTVMERLVER